ncbi:hypothetical protein EZS27_029991 [termite gut metagenome]|uniref:Uncharacterized protein n=1 Tax=termite gut metagenome TaxID=433724 RepID=A0A5J4QHY5_9ZZZZ
MNVIQRPLDKEFSATMRDYIIDSDAVITFSVKYNNKTILEEEYVPDADFKIKIRKLGKFCQQALWGEWCTESSLLQSSAGGTFEFYINEILDTSSYVLFCRMQTNKAAASATWLSEVNRKITRLYSKEYVGTVIVAGQSVQVTVKKNDGTTLPAKTLYTHTGTLSVVTVDGSPSRIATLFLIQQDAIRSYVLSVAGQSFEFLIDATRYTEVWQFRYKNVYDMPEVLTAVGGLNIKGNNEGETAAMFDVERKFALKVTDEYTANSGVIFLQSDYKLWHNLFNAQEVQIYVAGDWYSIIITKQTYEREFRRSTLKAVEFSFKMANPEQNNLIEL